MLATITVLCALWTTVGAVSSEIQGVRVAPPPRTLDLLRFHRWLVFLEVDRGRISIAFVSTADDLLARASAARVRSIRQRAIVVDPDAFELVARTADESMSAVSIGIAGPPHPAYICAAAWTFANFLLVLERLVRRAAGLTRRQRRIRRGLCAECGYNLTGNVSGVCPECGTIIRLHGGEAS